ncbi:hypothetical protein MKW92_002743 [Papaver armeniacum]|nr:hypothetical protein MKW92_002743 [Papaver armeniacum]
MNSMGADCFQGSSYPSSLLRIRRRHYKTKTVGANSSDAHGLGASNGKTSFKRLRKGDQLLPFTFKGPRPRINYRSLQKTSINKGYSFKEASSYGPGRRARITVSSDEVLRMETESSHDISYGCPKAVRGNDFSNTLFLEDTSSSKDNATTAHEVVLSPKPTRDNGEKLSNHPCHSNPCPTSMYFDVGMMGSGSTNPCPENENVRVCRPTSILQSYPRHYFKSATQLNGALKQRALEGGADAGLRLEIIRLESKNTELSAAIRVLTEELAGARQELANSKSRELQLQLFLEEIGDVLPDSWEH